MPYTIRFQAYFLYATICAYISMQPWLTFVWQYPEISLTERGHMTTQGVIQ